MIKNRRTKRDRKEFFLTKTSIGRQVTYNNGGTTINRVTQSTDCMQKWCNSFMFFKEHTALLRPALGYSVKFDMAIVQNRNFKLPRPFQAQL